MISIEIRPEAEAEIREAFAWYEEKRRGLGHQFLVSLASVLERVRRHARSFPADDSGLHKAIIRRFPYIIYFELEEDRACILAVYHGHRRPRTWTDRISEPELAYA
jgi:toxin ParE1/3/4